MIESVHISSFFDKIKHKKTMKSSLRGVSKSEYHSTYTMVVLPQYSLRAIEIKQEHLRVLRIFTFILILANTIVLSVDSVNFSNKTRQILRIIDFAFLLLFYIEVTIKFFFQKKFLKRFLNLLDLFIFILNLSVQIYFFASKCDFLSEDFACNGNLYDLIRVFQVLRIMRILISNVWVNISILILEFLKILKRMFGFLTILMIFLVLFSLIGRDFFKIDHVSSNHGTNILTETLERVNFNDFLNAFFTNFLIFIDEEWHLIMFAFLKTFPNAEVILYFVVNIIFCTIFLNKVFLAFLISNLIESKNIKKMIYETEFEASKLKDLLRKILNFLSCGKLFKKIVEKSEIPPEKQFSIKSQTVCKPTKAITLSPLERPSLTVTVQKSNRERLRTKICQIRKNRYFSNFMMFSLALSLLILALYDPYQSQESQHNSLLTYCDIPVFIVFQMDLIFELISHENGYFSITIAMKLAVCVLYLFYFIFQLELLKLLLVFRLFLVLNFSTELKTAFKALLKSVLDILQLFFFFLIISVLFALIGVKGLRGAFWFCDGLSEEFLENIITKQDCLDFGGDWLNRDYNFDNIAKALETLFMMANTEGWLPLMYYYYLFFFKKIKNQ